MIIKDNIRDYLPLNDLDDIYVVADFDRTITNECSNTSWSILAKSNLVSKSYVQERQKLFDYYRPIEISDKIDVNTKMKQMKTWYKKHISLFIKYKISEDVFQKVATDLRVMEFRTGAKEFIEYMHQNNIPLIIISAGIGNFIEKFLKHNNCYFDNIYVSSNKIIFENGVAVGVDDNIIHSLNKNEVSLPKNICKKIENKNTVILLGDQLSDLNMVDENKHKNVIKVCFKRNDTSVEALETGFDIICEENDDYTKLKRVLF